MLVERSLHPRYLSNAYLVADEEGGAALYVDSGAPLEPLRAAADRWRVKPELVLRTHSHADHVEHEGELGLPVRTDAVEVGGLRVEALPTPGHSDDMVAFVVDGEAATGIGREMENTGLAIDRAKDKTEQMQARAAAIDELVSTGGLEELGSDKTQLDRELSQLASQQQVDRELEQLKAEVGSGSAPPKEIEEAPPSN